MGEEIKEKEKGGSIFYKQNDELLLKWTNPKLTC